MKKEESKDLKRWSFVCSIDSFLSWIRKFISVLTNVANRTCLESVWCMSHLTGYFYVVNIIKLLACISRIFLHTTASDYKSTSYKLQLSTFLYTACSNFTHRKVWWLQNQKESGITSDAADYLNDHCYIRIFPDFVFCSFDRLGNVVKIIMTHW